MKTLTILAVFFFCLQGLSAQVFKNDELSITQLENDMYVVETSDMTTMYIIVGKDKAMLIDTGTKCKNLDNIVRKITKKPLYVIVTHVHVDHAGNINYFDSIYFHRADSVLMGRLREPYHGKINYISDGDVFDLGGKKIVVSHIPGHTPGSIILLDYQSGNAYTGDAFGSGQVWLQLWPFSPMSTYAASCKKMLKIMDKGISKIYCGHYPYLKKTYDKSYISGMYELARMIEKGTQPTPKPHPIIIPVIGAKKPMMSTYKQATIVYDPEHIKATKD